MIWLEMHHLQLNLVLSRYLILIWATSYTMNSLQSRVQARAVGSPGPIGITTPSSSFTALSGLGAVLPTPFVECLPGGRLAAQQSALNFSFMPPRATQQSKSIPVLLSREVKQQLADLEDMSAKQTPLPNMQPVTGAQGGAIRRPWLRIPTKLVSLLPCHSSILLSMSLVQRMFSASLLREKRSTSQRSQEVWVEACVVFRQRLINSNSLESLWTGLTSLCSFLKLESSSFSDSFFQSMRAVATLISESASNISILAFTNFSESRMKLLILENPKS